MESGLVQVSLSSLPVDPAGQMDVFGHDAGLLDMDSTQVSALEQTHQVSLACLLQSNDGQALEVQVGLEVLSSLADQALEGQLPDQLPDQQLCGLLVEADLPQSHGTRPVVVRLLHPTSDQGTLPGNFVSELPPGGLYFQWIYGRSAWFWP